MSSEKREGQQRPVVRFASSDDGLAETPGKAITGEVGSFSNGKQITTKTTRQRRKRASRK